MRIQEQTELIRLHADRLLTLSNILTMQPDPLDRSVTFDKIIDAIAHIQVMAKNIADEAQELPTFSSIIL